MLETSTKIRNYAGGEIRQTADGYYIFVKDDSHAGPYVSIASLKGAIQPTTNTTDETADGEAIVLDGATEEELLAEGVSQEDIDQAVADGTEVEPTTNTTDEAADGEAIVLDGATEEELLAEGVSQEDIDQAVADGTEVEPTTNTTDEAADGEAAEAGDK